MDANGEREIDWEIAKLSGGLSAARRFTPAHQGSLRPCDWNLEESEEGPLSERGDTLAHTLAAHEASTKRPILESLAPMSMESAALVGSDYPPPQAAGAPRKRPNHVENALWAGAAASMSILALGLVMKLGLQPVSHANAALDASPPAAQMAAPATVAMVPESGPVGSRPTVMLDTVLVSGDARAVGARTAAAPARTAALSPAAAMAASFDAISPQVAIPRTPTASDPGPVGISRPAAAVAISASGRGAASCLKPGDARGSMPVSVTFAPSGRVTTSTVNGGPFAGTTTGGCIARALRGASIAPFDGGPVTIHGSVSFR